MFDLPPDPYAILGVPKNAQLPEIRSAHRKLVLKCHPDKVTDPTQKVAKQAEFQRVQRAYEILSDETERCKYDDKVRANEAQIKNQAQGFSSGRTPPSHSDLPKDFTVRNVSPQTHYNVKVRPPATFTRASTMPTMPPEYFAPRDASRSYEERNRSSFDEPKSARKKSSYEKESPSKREREREEEKRRRKADEEWQRERERGKERERRKKEQERKDMEAKEKERKEKDRRDRDKKKTEKERKREAEEQRSRNKTTYVDELPELEEHSDYNVYNAPSPGDKKSSKSSRSLKPEVPIQEANWPPTDNLDNNLEFAASYLERSKTSKVSYNIRNVAPAAPTPPPANVAFPPPPMQEDAARRSSAKASSRRPSYSREKTSSSYKKASPIAIDPQDLRAPPSLKKSQTMPTHFRESPPRRATEGYTRSIPVPLGRAQTWYPGEDERDRSYARHVRSYSDDDSEEEIAHRTRRTHSPEGQTSSRYKVGTNNRTVPVAHYAHGHDVNYRAKYDVPEANIGRRVERSDIPTHGGYTTHATHHSYGSPAFPKIKMGQSFGTGDVRYGDVLHSYA